MPGVFIDPNQIAVPVFSGVHVVRVRDDLPSVALQCSRDQAVQRVRGDLRRVDVGVYFKDLRSSVGGHPQRRAVGIDGDLCRNAVSREGHALNRVWQRKELVRSA